MKRSEWWCFVTVPWFSTVLKWLLMHYISTLPYTLECACKFTVQYSFNRSIGKCCFTLKEKEMLAHKGEMTCRSYVTYSFKDCVRLVLDFLMCSRSARWQNPHYTLTHRRRYSRAVFFSILFWTCSSWEESTMAERKSFNGLTGLFFIGRMTVPCPKFYRYNNNVIPLMTIGD